MQIEIPAQAGQVLETVKPLFGGSLLGFYLYGSATYGGLHPDSDVDLLAVLDRPMTDTERKSLTAALLVCSGRVDCADKRPLEVTVVDRAAVSGFPPVYEYMYGEWLRAAMESGNISGACADPAVADADVRRSALRRRAFRMDRAGLSGGYSARDCRRSARVASKSGRR